MSDYTHWTILFAAHSCQPKNYPQCLGKVSNNKMKQAGAELCQAKFQLGMIRQLIHSTILYYTEIRSALHLCMFQLVKIMCRSFPSRCAKRPSNGCRLMVSIVFIDGIYSFLNVWKDLEITTLERFTQSTYMVNAVEKSPKQYNSFPC